jgi:hypothetical protein
VTPSPQSPSPTPQAVVKQRQSPPQQPPEQTHRPIKPAEPPQDIQPGRPQGQGDGKRMTRLEFGLAQMDLNRQTPYERGTSGDP